MNVVEEFISINGEGIYAGELAYFVRFKGCNLNCSYCDTRWANQEETPFIVQSPSQVLEHILFSKIMHVTLTGGEPLLQKDIGELLRLLLSNEKINVEIETNGSIDISPFCNYSKRPIFTIDYKLDSSECMEYMLFSNFDLLCKNDSIKFVIGNQEDINTAISIVLCKI